MKNKVTTTTTAAATHLLLIDVVVSNSQSYKIFKPVFFTAYLFSFIFLNYADNLRLFDHMPSWFQKSIERCNNALARSLNFRELGISRQVDSTFS